MTKNKYDFSLTPLLFIKKYMKLVCRFCEKDIYEWVGPEPTPEMVVMAEYLNPIDKNVNNPVNGDGVVCPFCKKPILLIKDEND